MVGFDVRWLAVGTGFELNSYLAGWMMTVQALRSHPASQDNSTSMPWSELAPSQAFADRPRAGRPSEDPFV